jgi:hypothetical protein
MEQTVAFCSFAYGSAVDRKHALDPSVVKGTYALAGPRTPCSTGVGPLPAGCKRYGLQDVGNVDDA